MTPAEPDSSALKSSVAFTGRLACMTRAEAFDALPMLRPAAKKGAVSTPQG